MANDEETKLIIVNILLWVRTSQSFEVPLDYEIKGSTSKEAYENLLNEFEEQNMDAIHKPEWVELGEFCAEFLGVENRFYIVNNLNGENSYKYFDSEK